MVATRIITMIPLHDCEHLGDRGPHVSLAVVSPPPAPAESRGVGKALFSGYMSNGLMVTFDAYPRSHELHLQYLTEASWEDGGTER